MKLTGHLIVLLVAVAAFSIPAQSDTLNLHQILNQQIMEAMQKKHDSLLGNKIEAEKKAVSEDKSAIPETVKEAAAVENNSFILKLAVLGFAALAVFSFILFKRVKKADKGGSNDLKRNIKLLREEKLACKENPALKKTRVSLGREKIEFDDNKISAAARNLKISKGELYLAAKLKQKAAGSINMSKAV